MKYLIINFYSPHNAGDLAILEQTIKLIKLCDLNARICVCISDPSFLPFIEGVTWVRSWNSVILEHNNRVEAVWSLYRAYTNADIVVSLGGGYFFVHDYRPFSIYATFSLIVALFIHKPVVCLPQSFGPFRYHYQARLAARFLRNVQELMIREEASYFLLRKVDPLLAKKTLLVPDTAFTLALENNSTKSLNKLSHRRPKIGITLLDWSNVNPLFKTQSLYEQSFAGFIIYLWRELHAQITLFVQCRSAVRNFEGDLNVTQRVADLAIRIDNSVAEAITIQLDLVTPEDYLHAYGEMDYFIGTRMHSLIFATCAGVPVMAIGYQHKSLGLMRMLRLDPYYLEISHLTSEQIIQVFQKGWDRRGILKADIDEQVKILAIRSKKAIMDALIRAQNLISDM